VNQQHSYMTRLSRTVRLTVHPPRDTGTAPQPHAGLHAVSLRSGQVSGSGLGAYFACTVTCLGSPNPVSGYVISIGDIDSAVRQALPPLLREALWPDSGTTAASAADPVWLVRTLGDRLSEALGRPIAALSLHVNPYDAYAWEAHMPDTVLLTAQIECAAAHRLHAPTLDDAANRALFGKCNNPNGHGHNYRVEATVAVSLSDPTRMGMSHLARILAENVERRMDHRHLNLDVPEFSDTIPSVEHIAAACRSWLEGPVRASGGRLVRVTVWETEKTSATVEA
jgi:6-pyruvoyltetrahydropterin/6-carboxytetrahydropterin synthase